MRQLGKLDSETDVRRIADYLLTLGIKTHAEQEAAGWGLWVYHEDHVQQARQEFAEFLKNPADPRYQNVAKAAAEVREAEIRKGRVATKQIIDVRQRWESSGSGMRTPITVVLVVACVFVAFATGLQPQKSNVAARLMIAAPSDRWPDFEQVDHGEVWRLITPIFVHFDTLHLLFNMLCLIPLGGDIERARGSLRLLLLVLFIGVTSNLAEYAVSGPNFGGMSGVVYGLFGYSLMKSRYEPDCGLYVSSQMTFMMLAWLAVGWLGLVKLPDNAEIANTAHMMGLAVGMVCGSTPMVWRRLVQR